MCVDKQMKAELQNPPLRWSGKNNIQPLCPVILMKYVSWYVMIQIELHCSFYWNALVHFKLLWSVSNNSSDS